MDKPLEDRGSHQRTHEQKENPHPGSDNGTLTTFAQIRKQAIDRDRAEESGCGLGNGSQRHSVGKS